MKASILATKMLRLEDLWERVADLEDEIKDAVFDLQKTQTVGTVRASYSGGRKSYQYALCGLDASQEIIDNNTKIIPEQHKVNWRAVCQEAELEVTFTQSAPTVTLKAIK